MADIDHEADLKFEESGEVEEELVFLEEGQAAPPEEDGEDPKVKELEEQVAALKVKADSNQAITEGLAGLGDKLNRPAQVQPPQGPQETEEEYFKRVGDDLFKADQPGEVLKGVFTKAKNEATAGISQQLLAQQKDILKMSPEHGDLFKKYEQEIEAKRATLPAAQQLDPRSYNWALDQVKAAHFEDLVEEKLNAKIEEEVEKRLKAQGGSGNGSARGNRSSTFTEGGGVGAPVVKRKAKYVSAEKKAFAERMAMQKGLPLERVIDQIDRGIIRWNPSR